MACQADERTGNLSELPRSKADFQGWFAGIALARSRNRRCRLTVVETHFPNFRGTHAWALGYRIGPETRLGHRGRSLTFSL